jgi:rhodanese-related sulfurtransferase
MNRFTRKALFVSLLVALGARAGEPLAPHEIELGKMIVKVRQKFPGVKQLSTTNLAAWLADASRPQPQLLDVRTPKEYAVSHLVGARQISPNAKAEAVLDTLDQQRPVVVYCSVGYRSCQFVERLQAAGLVQVMNLEGSIFAWANEDRPLEQDGQPATKVHPYDKVYGRMLKPERRAP